MTEEKVIKEKGEKKPGMEYVSFSRMRSFANCPKVFWFSYIKGIKIKPSFYKSLGTWGHSAMEKTLKNKKENKEDLSLKEFCGVWEDRFDKERAETDWEGQDPWEFKTSFLGTKGGYGKSRRGILPIIHEQHLPILDPVLVEEKIETTIKTRSFSPSRGWEDIEVPVVGVVDFYGEDGQVRDWKFRKTDRHDEKVSDQLTMYGMFLKERGHEIKRYSEDNMVYGTQKISVHPTERTEEDFTRMRVEITEFWKLIHKLGDDPENYPFTSRGNWTCCKERCGYWSLCPRGGGNYGV